MEILREDGGEEKMKMKSRESQTILEIPNDLIKNILLRLPARSLGRMVCVSKLFASIIRHPGFIDLAMTRSLNRQHHLTFLLCFTTDNRSLSFYSWCPTSGNGLSVVSRTMEFLKPGARDLLAPYYLAPYYLSCPVAGLILCRNCTLTGSMVALICNPTTGQVITLPKLRYEGKFMSYYLGYDPIGYQYKVLCLTRSESNMTSEEHHVLTLGDQRSSWRKIQCSTPHPPIFKGLCLNGIIYYGAETDRGVVGLVSFDVRSEEFGFIGLHVSPGDRPLTNYCRVVNYRGKVAVVGSMFHLVELWILEDAMKQEWTYKRFHLSCLPDDMEPCDTDPMYVVGITPNGDIVFASHYLSYRSFKVILCNPEEDTSRRFEITGEIYGYGSLPRGQTLHYHGVSTFMGHADSIIPL